MLRSFIGNDPKEKFRVTEPSASSATAAMAVRVWLKSSDQAIGVASSSEQASSRIEQE